jgi:hypothetical protein
VYAGATFRALSHRPTKSCSDRAIGTSRTAGSKATFVLGRYATRALLAFSPACSLNSHRGERMVDPFWARHLDPLVKLIQ